MLEPFGPRADRRRPRAIICDLDDTLCCQFDQPIVAGVRTLQLRDRDIQVHYVTARPEASRTGTEKFLADQRIPGRHALYFCPDWKSSRQHKIDVMCELAREFQVLVSVGDHDEDESASQAAGVPFVRVSWEQMDAAWAEVANLLASK